MLHVGTATMISCSNMRLMQLALFAPKAQCSIPGFGWVGGSSEHCLQIMLLKGAPCCSRSMEHKNGRKCAVEQVGHTHVYTQLHTHAYVYIHNSAHLYSSCSSTSASKRCSSCSVVLTHQNQGKRSTVGPCLICMFSL